MYAEEMGSSSDGSEVNGGIIKFKNRRCFCGKKATVKISESTRNPSKLYFSCEQGKCKYYSFWTPDNEEFSISNEVISQHRQRRSMQPAELNTLLENREITINVRNSDGLLATMKMMLVFNIVFLILSIVVLILAIMNMK